MTQAFVSAWIRINPLLFVLLPFVLLAARIGQPGVRRGTCPPAVRVRTLSNVKDILEANPDRRTNPMRKAIVLVAACAMLLAASCSGPKPGTVKGTTLHVVMGHPGAWAGKPDPDWKPPEPTPVGGALILFLRTDAGGRDELYGTTSSDDGRYTIDLPPGEYAVACFTEDIGWWEEAQGLLANRNDPEYKRERLRFAFDWERDDEDGNHVYKGMGPVTVEPGAVVEGANLPAVILCVD